MIFAHGPVGFLTISGVIRRWFSGCSRRQWLWFASIGWIGGIFPDIDLFYFYLLDASRPHRYLLTHTPVPYLIVLLLCGVLLLFKRRAAAATLGAFALGSFTHLLADTIIGQVRLFYPLSNHFFSLSNSSIVLLQQNVLWLSFFLEGVCICWFFLVLVRRYARGRARIFLSSAIAIAFVAGASILTVANQHIYHPGGTNLFADSDADGMDNILDSDMDGDGVQNFSDRDANDNGTTNALEFSALGQQLEGSWYDPTNGGLIEIPMRLGLLTTASMPERVYAAVGMPLRPDMATDYAVNPSGYARTPQQTDFTDNPQNLRAWFDHNGWLRKPESTAPYNLGDIVFFADDFLAIVLGITDSGQPLLLDVHPDRPVQLRPLDDLIVDTGPVYAHAVAISTIGNSQ